MSNSQPNILLIISDHHSDNAFGSIDNDYINTPGIDQIAREGIRFKKAYCTQPLCVPSRNSMFTGRMPYEGNIHYNIHKAPKMLKFPWIGKKLYKAGYDTAYFGKWHLAPSIHNKKIHGFQEVSMAGGGKKDLKITPEICKYIKKKRKKPFFLVASYNNPHNICQWIRGQRPLPIKPLPDPPEMDKCPPLPENHKIPENEPLVIRKMWKKFGKKHYPVDHWGEKEWREYLWAFMRLIEITDSQIQMVLKSLEECNKMEDTVIIYLSDHGEGMGQFKWTQKQVLYESPTRVPFIISQKGTTIADHKDEDHIVSTGLDLFPTICDFAGVRPKDKIWGLSLRKLALGEESEDVEARTFVPAATEFGEFEHRAWPEHINPMGRMIRTKSFKYIIYSEGQPMEQLFDLNTNSEQLFDMENDPLEMINLATNPNYRDILNQHRDLLIEWVRLTKDSFFNPKWLKDKSILSKIKDVIQFN